MWVIILSILGKIRNGECFEFALPASTKHCLFLVLCRLHQEKVLYSLLDCTLPSSNMLPPIRYGAYATAPNAVFVAISVSISHMQILHAAHCVRMKKQVWKPFVNKRRNCWKKILKILIQMASVRIKLKFGFK